MSKIEWTDVTWNPVRGCEVVSPGCSNCYAMRFAHRFSGPGRAYEGLTKLGGRGPVWTGRVRLVPEEVDAPLHWKKPRRIFVNSMSDLFHEDVPFEFIDRVFAVMALAYQHTFQILTKRPTRMLEYFARPDLYESVLQAANPLRADHPKLNRVGISNPATVPLRNVWLGVSVEDQARADERIPILLQVPARVRFLSCEPLLGPLDLSPFMPRRSPWHGTEIPKDWASFQWPDWVPSDVQGQIESFWSELSGRSPQQWLENAAASYNHAPPFGGAVSLRPMSAQDPSVRVNGRYVHAWNNIGRLILTDGTVEYVSTCGFKPSPSIHWVIAGGESSHGARPTHPDWVRALRDQCAASGTSFFFKQWGEHGTSSVRLTTGEPVFRTFTSFEQWVDKAQTRVQGGVCVDLKGKILRQGADFQSASFPVVVLDRVGKKAAGRLLDGREWDEFPGASR